MCVYLLVQGHFPNVPQLPAGPDPRRSSETDRRVRLSAEGTSSCAAFRQTPPGQTDVSITLLRLPERTKEQVGMHQKPAARDKNRQTFLSKVPFLICCKVMSKIPPVVVC